VVADNVSNLIVQVQKSLKSGVNLHCMFSVDFRVDVFNFLFKGKGRAPPAGHGLFYDLSAFSSTYFPADWHVVYDRLGDGCRIDFPVRLESMLKWSSKVYIKDATSGNILLKPRTFTEIVCVKLVKCRC